jgi:hypothetical protein
MNEALAYSSEPPSIWHSAEHRRRPRRRAADAYRSFKRAEREERVEIECRVQEGDVREGRGQHAPPVALAEDHCVRGIPIESASNVLVSQRAAHRARARMLAQS